MSVYNANHSCPSWPCPICYPQLRPPHYPPGWPQYYGYGTPAVRGCVCPAGAEITCQGLGCPRKGVGGGVACSASAIEAASAGETGNTDSTEGESAAPSGETPK